MSNPVRVMRSLKSPETPALGEVVTLAESLVITGKSRTAVINAVVGGKVKGRRSLTGGEWLIDLTSLVAYYPAGANNTWLVK